jgi:hypothetical protein
MQDRLDIPTWTGQGSVKGARTEVLWSNRPLAAQIDLFGADEADESANVGV